MARIVVGISGASGIILAHRLIDALLRLGHFVELVMSRDAALTAMEEMGQSYASPQRFAASFPQEFQERLRWHQISDFCSPIASGSFRVDACVIIPCSMTSLAAITVGLADNLLRRAADVALKEKRKLILVPREAPLHAIHLENMLKLAQLGAVIMPPVPAWYMKPTSLADVEDFLTGRLLDQLGIDAPFIQRWKGSDQ